MKKRFWLSGTVLVSTVLLTETVAFCQELSPGDLNLPLNAPYCFIVSPEGQLVNLERLCGSAASNPNATNQPTIRAAANSFVPYADNTAGNLGGLNTGGSTRATPCYGLDAQGRPCS
jgi:hypothetical protein